MVLSETIGEEPRTDTRAPAERCALERPDRLVRRCTGLHVLARCQMTRPHNRRQIDFVGQTVAVFSSAKKEWARAGHTG